MARTRSGTETPRVPVGRSAKGGANAVATSRAPPRTGLLYDQVYLKHSTGAGHPERPERLSAILDRLRRVGLLAELTRITPRAADLRWLTTVHGRAYVQRVEASCLAGLGHVGPADAPVGPESYAAAVTAVGGVLAAVDAVMEGRLRNAFCAVRPPGHHALPEKAMGFCLFNTVAIAAKYIQQRAGLARVLIVDWDVHHGNGTQAVFYGDPGVFYFSIHQSPFYPGTGAADERGVGDGLGSTLNVPLPAGTSDATLQAVFEGQLTPAALTFAPDFVLVSAGFDAHEDDPLGQMSVTPEGFASLTRVVKSIADQCCGGRLVSVLEGGYHLEGLAASVEAHVRELRR